MSILALLLLVALASGFHTGKRHQHLAQSHADVRDTRGKLRGARAARRVSAKLSAQAWALLLLVTVLVVAAAAAHR